MSYRHQLPSHRMARLLWRGVADIRPVCRMCDHGLRNSFPRVKCGSIPHARRRLTVAFGRGDKIPFAKMKIIIRHLSPWLWPSQAVLFSSAAGNGTSSAREHSSPIVRWIYLIKLTARISDGSTVCWPTVRPSRYVFGLARYLYGKKPGIDTPAEALTYLSCRFNNIVPSKAHSWRF